MIHPRFLCCCWQLAAEGILCSVCLSKHVWTYTKSLSARCLTNRSWQFRQINNFGAIDDRDEQSRFRSEKVRGQSGQRGTWHIL